MSSTAKSFPWGTEWLPWSSSPSLSDRFPRMTSWLEVGVHQCTWLCTRGPGSMCTFHFISLSFSPPNILPVLCCSFSPEGDSYKERFRNWWPDLFLESENGSCDGDSIFSLLFQLDVVFFYFFFFLGERKRNFTAFLAVGMSGRKSIIYTHTNTLTTSSRTLPTFLQECEIVVVKLLVCRVEETILLKNLMILGILFVICKRCYIYIILYVFMSGLCSLQ